MQYRLGEVHVRQQQLRGDFFDLEEETLVAHEDFVGRLEESERRVVSHLRHVPPPSAAPMPPTSTSTDPVLMGGLLWLLKNATVMASEQQSQSLWLLSSHAHSLRPKFHILACSWFANSVSHCIANLEAYGMIG